MNTFDNPVFYERDRSHRNSVSSTDSQSVNMYNDAYRPSNQRLIHHHVDIGGSKNPQQGQPGTSGQNKELKVTLMDVDNKFFSSDESESDEESNSRVASLLGGANRGSIQNLNLA